MIVSFDLGPGGAITNVRPTREVGRLADSTWQVVHDHGAVSIYAMHEGRVTRIAAATLTARGKLEARRALPTHAVAWTPIAAGLCSALQRPQIELAGKIEIDASVATESTVAASEPEPGRTARVGKVAIAGVVLVGFVVGPWTVQVVEYGIWMWSLAPLVVGIGASWLVWRGLAILASPEAREEPTQRDLDGETSPGPIAKGGLLRLTFGGLLYAGVILSLVLSHAPSGTPATRPSPQQLERSP